MRNRLRSGWMEWLLILAAALLFTYALLFPLRYALSEGLTAEERQLQEAFQQQEIIRLHVVAHSDSPEDQAIKLRVRDALIEAFGKELASAGEAGYKTACQILESSVDRMQRTAQACAAEHDFYGNVRAEYGLMPLPEKQYGSVVLPQGDYRALRITLGEGKGQNWWCVLYPQLCLALSQNTKTEETDFFWSSERILRCWLLKGK